MNILPASPRSDAYANELQGFPPEVVHRIALVVRDRKQRVAFLSCCPAFHSSAAPLIAAARLLEQAGQGSPQQRVARTLAVGRSVHVSIGGDDWHDHLQSLDGLGPVVDLALRGRPACPRNDALASQQRVPTLPLAAFHGLSSLAPRGTKPDQPTLDVVADCAAGLREYLRTSGESSGCLQHRIDSGEVDLLVLALAKDAAKVFLARLLDGPIVSLQHANVACSALITAAIRLDGAGLASAFSYLARQLHAPCYAGQRAAVVDAAHAMLPAGLWQAVAPVDGDVAQESRL